ncbi:ArsB/NhaD family transporter [Natronobiforma cellulositropha]|uniref:SLC13 family permease n=1 Tax=Natronobiforma cellulositropha TaxID=1679076 RepID=UPI0021D593A0|nr:SLC13 family permease [Natronobiforma cellulositropha]
MAPEVAVTALVLGTFALLFVRRIRAYPVSRAVTSALGAVCVVAIGAITLEEALASVHVGTILLLFGMLAHVDALARSGFYTWAAARLVQWAGTGRRLTYGTLCLAAGSSAFALNDATVLLMTPVLVVALHGSRVDPVAPLLAVILGANIGSVATPLGNPQNAYILSRSELTTLEFVAALGPVALVSLAVAAAFLWPLTRADAPFSPVEVPDLDTRWALSSAGFLLVTFLALAAFPGVEPGFIAASLGIVHVAWLQFYRRVPGNDVLQGVDWSILVLFVGMFVLVGSLEGTALLEFLGGFDGVAAFAGATFVLSNLVSNVPAVLVLAETVDDASGWLLLAAVSTLAGNATPIASAATLIVLDQAARSGVDVPIRRLIAIGFPVALLTSALAVVMLVSMG